MGEKEFKRNIYLFGIFVVLMLLLVIRLYYIQIICHEELSFAAQSQYEVLVEGIDTRGMIFDRNYIPLIGNTNQYYYFIKKENYDGKLKQLLKETASSRISSNSAKYYIYRTEKYNENINQKLKDDYNAYVFQSTARYCDSQLACHLIGYLNEDEKRGVSGLEYLYQDLLEADKTTLSIWADGTGNILVGTSPYKLNIGPDNPFSDVNNVGVVTTIDYKLQSEAEKAIAQKSGAVLVMDADNGEVLAWASSPTFNPNRIEDYLQVGEDCLINKASQAAYPPGSVFKIVTALAGIENGVDMHEEYICTGSTEVEGITIGCMAGPKGGHGSVDMKKAMAVSCNCYFAELGEKIGCEQIIEVASKMGFGQKTMKSFPEEIEGNLPKIEDVGPWDTSNISVGQGDLLVTPLQICQMTATIANGGYLVEPKVILDNSFEKVKVIEDYNVLNLRECMKEVMLSGTAKAQWELDVYGKTGTAEVGSYGENLNVCWFTGYCRQNDRNYVITVMIDKGTSGTKDAVPVFKSIVGFLNKN